jgi:hypothetical protein
MKGQNHPDQLKHVEQDMALLGHELDNVLNGLLGMSQLLRESGLNAEQERWSRAIEHAGRQLRRLVSTFRAGPGLADRGPVPHAQCIDGIDLLEQVLLSHAPAALTNGDRLLLTVTPEVRRQWVCDPCLLRQVLDNLLGNAIKFTAGGEVLLHVAALRVRPGWLRMTVLDTGPGIDPAVGERIFEAGDQGRPDTQSRFGGSGLGLFVCRRAVAALGGTLNWSPAQGGGSRFEILLPAGIQAGSRCGSGAGVQDGSVDGPADGPARSSLILPRLSCRLALSGYLFESVSGWLERLGVPWQPAGAVERAIDPAGLAVVVSEHPAAAGRPGPTLLLQPLNDGGKPVHSCAVPTPVLCCTLGPALLGMALEWLWLRNEKPGSAP